MAIQVNPTQYVDNNAYQKSEWIVTGESDLENIPPVAAGSVAYSADLTFIAMFDGTEWKVIKGGGD